MKNLIFTVLAIASYLFGNAQSSASVSQTITLNLQNQIDISVVNGTATGTSFTFSSTNDYASGLTNTNASSFQVRSNRAWAVTVAAGAANFTSAATTVMPANRLSVRLNGGATFGALSTTGASLTSGSRGINSFAVDYNANPGFNYDAGTYTLSVVYTATQQ